MTLLQQILIGQYEAALCMLRQAVAACPPEAWEAKLANGTVRWAAYHTLVFVDVYLGPNIEAFAPRDLHRAGGNELGSEPAAGLPQAQTLELLDQCVGRMREVLAAETDATLAAPDGFGRGMTRGELHVYNIRHVQHHAGAISAFVRRMRPDLGRGAMPWVGRGWRGDGRADVRAEPTQA